MFGQCALITCREESGKGPAKALNTSDRASLKGFEEDVDKPNVLLCPNVPERRSLHYAIRREHQIYEACVVLPAVGAKRFTEQIVALFIGVPLAKLEPS